ncbi:MAG: bifunctional 5,10-methylenetetrahydrofolate dehydrogenase/5,10-methenyltetrahydrofolate cyclohydrolase [bacterium]
MTKIDGRAIASAIIEDVRLGAKGRQLTIAALYAGNDRSTLSYIKSKKKQSARAGIELNIIHMESDTEPDAFYSKVDELNNDRGTDGIIVEKPLPQQIDFKTVSQILDYKKDIDCITPVNNGKLITDEFEIAPSTAMAVVNILKYQKTDITGKRAVIIGRSEIVGKPLSLLLVSKKLDNHATVTLTHSRTRDLKAETRGADIIIAAIGKPEFLRIEHISSQKPMLIDVGINYKSGRLCGDIDPRCYELASFYTPVPGGVGPVTVATLFSNLLKLKEIYG